jgi:hypothetical protein
VTSAVVLVGLAAVEADLGGALVVVLVGLAVVEADLAAAIVVLVGLAAVEADLAAAIVEVLVAPVGHADKRVYWHQADGPDLWKRTSDMTLSSLR